VNTVLLGFWFFLEENYAREDLLRKFYAEPDFEKSKSYFIQFQMWILENHEARILQIRKLLEEGQNKIVMDRSILATVGFLSWYSKIGVISKKKRNCLITLAQLMWDDFLAFIKENFDKTILVNLVCPPEIAWERYVVRQNTEPTKLSVHAFRYLKRHCNFKKSVWSFSRSEEYDTSTITPERLLEKVKTLCQ